MLLSDIKQWAAIASKIPSEQYEKWITSYREETNNWPKSSPIEFIWEERKKDHIVVFTRTCGFQTLDVVGNPPAWLVFKVMKHQLST